MSAADDEEHAARAWREAPSQVVDHAYVALIPAGEHLRAAVVVPLAGGQEGAKHALGVTAVQCVVGVRLAQVFENALPSLHWRRGVGPRLQSGKHNVRGPLELRSARVERQGESQKKTPYLLIVSHYIQY